MKQIIWILLNILAGKIWQKYAQSVKNNIIQTELDVYIFRVAVISNGGDCVKQQRPGRTKKMYILEIIEQITFVFTGERLK